MDSGNLTQVVRLGSKFPYSLRCLHTPQPRHLPFPFAYWRLSPTSSWYTDSISLSILYLCPPSIRLLTVGNVLSWDDCSLLDPHRQVRQGSCHHVTTCRELFNTPPLPPGQLTIITSSSTACFALPPVPLFSVNYSLGWSWTSNTPAWASIVLTLQVCATKSATITWLLFWVLCVRGQGEERERVGMHVPLCAHGGQGTIYRNTSPFPLVF